MIQGQILLEGAPLHPSTWMCPQTCFVNRELSALCVSLGTLSQPVGDALNASLLQRWQEHILSCGICQSGSPKAPGEQSLLGRQGWMFRVREK